MKTVTKQDLGSIISHANKAYVDDAVGILDNKEFVAQCYLKACINYLGIKEEFEFPHKKDNTSIEDING